MSWIVRDFKCECGNVFDELLDNREPQEAPCKECGVINTPVMSCPAIATFSLMDKKAQKAHLLKRSEKHTKKLVKQNS